MAVLHGGLYFLRLMDLLFLSQHCPFFLSRFVPSAVQASCLWGWLLRGQHPQVLREATCSQTTPFLGYLLAVQYDVICTKGSLSLSVSLRKNLCCAVPFSVTQFRDTVNFMANTVCTTAVIVHKLTYRSLPLLANHLCRGAKLDLPSHFLNAGSKGN